MLQNSWLVWQSCGQWVSMSTNSHCKPCSQWLLSSQLQLRLVLKMQLQLSLRIAPCLQFPLVCPCCPFVCTLFKVYPFAAANLSMHRSVLFSHTCALLQHVLR